MPLLRENTLLTDLQVLDLADERASFCSKLLADFGAEVIKIERPGGDVSRRIGPFQGNAPHPERSLSFWHNNTNKLGITLNLEVSEGREIFLQLISKTDVITETFPAGYLERFKIGYETLTRINPRLILVSVTGFGQSGHYRQYKSCDIVASATGGQMYVCGASDTPPLKPCGTQSYYAASIFAAVGILIALRERNHSGKGQHIDISLQEAVAATLEHVLVDYLYEGVVSRRQDRPLHNGSFCLLPCKDGHILLTIDMNWNILVDWLDSEGMVDDLKEQRWQEEEYRRRHRAHIIDILTLWTKTHNRAELFELGQLMRLPWATVSTLEEMVNSVQLGERNFFTLVEHPELAPAGGTPPSYKYPGSPYRLLRSSRNDGGNFEAQDDRNQRNVRRAPLIGEHNAQIYQEKLGLSVDDLERLSADGVI